jgi:hypothetical protein
MFAKKTVLSALLAAGIGTLGFSSAFAAVSADEAKALGTTLTEFGAEKAGNADGSIPAYTGGLTLKDVPSYDANKNQFYVDPFAHEKPLYSIDAKNVAQYDAVLAVGTKALIKQYPGYRVDVYPSHRTAHYSPWVLANSVKNATTAKLGGPIEGDNLLGADEGNNPFPGVPFPIPKTGAEVIWNHFTHFAPTVTHRIDNGYLVDTAGNITYLPSVDEWFVHAWYDTNKTKPLRKEIPGDAIFGFNAVLTAPPTSAGIVFLNFYTARGEDGGQKVWFYTPGQRRVRMAPEFAYDVPIASYGGVIFWDEIFGYVGRLDRFEYKIVGKKEMIIPYNTFNATSTALEKDFLKAKYVNPDILRWEKHRVWVIEATRKPGARHIYSRRTFYIDEDSWAIVGADQYDNAGNIYRVQQNNIFPHYDTGGVSVDSWSTYDVIKGNFMFINVNVSKPGNLLRAWDNSACCDHMNLSPQAVAASGVR